MRSLPPGWISAHYHMGPVPAEGGPPEMVCTRCGEVVDWLTKHAVERHKDIDIEIMPTTRPEPADGWKW